jgi:hypothetical protein
LSGFFRHLKQAATWNLWPAQATTIFYLTHGKKGKVGCIVYVNWQFVDRHCHVFVIGHAVKKIKRLIDFRYKDDPEVGLQRLQDLCQAGLHLQVPDSEKRLKVNKTF